MDKETIEYYHDIGLMPDRAYYQQNGKSPGKNLHAQHEKMIQKQRIDRELEIYKARRKAEIDLELQNEIENEVAPQLEKAIDDLFKDWH